MGKKHWHGTTPPIPVSIDWFGSVDRLHCYCKVHIGG